MKSSVVRWQLAGCIAGWLFTSLPGGQAQMLAKAQKTTSSPGVYAPPARERQLKDVLNALSQTHGVSILFEEETVRGLSVLTESLVSRQRLGQQLTTILRPHALVFRKLRDGSYLVIPQERKLGKGAVGNRPPPPATESASGPTALVSDAVALQPTDITVRGTVTSSDNNEVLPGVSVTLKGTTRGTTTDAKGTFQLSVADSRAVLVFSYVGYQTQEVTVGNQQSVNIQLQPDNKSLNEVVVVGYGTVQKSDLTGSVAQLKTTGVGDQPITSVDQFVQGRVAGVQITQNTGAPGSGVTFLIRGASSATGSTRPLIILDGYPIESSDNSATGGGGSNVYVSQVPASNPLANLNPSDIESIDILKDASATAIYGSRGSNGVVLITTKRGKSGRDRIEYGFRMDFSQLPKKLPVLGTQDFLSFANEAAFNSGRDSVYKATDIAGFAGRNLFWQDLVYQTGVTQNHQLSLSGGDDKTRYSLQGNYFTQGGIIRNSSFERGSIRLNLDRQVSKRFLLRANLSASLSTTRLASQSNALGDASGSVVLGALSFFPIDIPFDPETQDPNADLVGNPLTLIQKLDDRARSRSLLLGLTADYRLTDHLVLRVNTGINQTDALRQSYLPRGTGQGNANNGLAFRGTNENFNYLTEYTLNYNQTFRQKHRINAVGGYTWQSWQNRLSGTTATNFPNDNTGFYNLQLAGASVPTTSLDLWALQSVLGRINYTFDNRYIFTVTGRADGSTRLAKGNQWSFFPSGAVGWNLHNESFLRDNNIITELKLRGSYGLTGNQSIPVGSSQDVLGTIRSVYGDAIVAGLLPSQIGNPNLRWETTTQADIGLETSLWQGRLTMGIDYYNRDTKDLLVNVGIPAATGFSTIAANAGIIRNRGVEVEATGRILTGRVRWNANGNITFNRNKVVDLNGSTLFGPGYGGDGRVALSQPLHITSVGNPIGAFYGYRITGIYQNADEVKSGPTDTSLPTPGDFRFADLNGDKVINADDRTIIGNPFPRYTFGLTNEFSWKSLSLSVFVMGNIGQDVINFNRILLDALNTNGRSNVSVDAFNGRWRGEGTSNNYPKPTATGNVFRSRFSDFLVEDGSFVRLKNITLSYTIPVKAVKWLQSARIYATASNLLTFTRYTGYDPEVNSRPGNALSPGVDFGTIPQVRSYSAGFNISF
ncbi:SusC/RagA family TonB-linked outer membrane protein [Spirosoma arcticum]